MAAGAHIKIGESGSKTVAAGFDRINKSVDRLGRTGVTTSAKLQRMTRGVSSRLRGLYLTLGGVGVVAASKRIMDFSDSLGKLQARTKMSTPEMQDLKKQILDVSVAYGLTKENVLGAIQTFQDFGGLVKEGRGSLSQLAMVAKASGAEMSDLAKIQTILIKQKLSPEDQIRALAMLNAQADAATVALEDVARVIPGIVASGGAYGFTGIRAVEQLGTALQIAGEATAGNAEEARTQVRALLRDLNHNAKKIQKLFGIKVFDQAGNMRDLDELMAEIMQATGGKMSGKKGLGQIFTAWSQTLAGAWGGAIKGGTVSKVMGVSKTAKASDLQLALQKRLTGVASEAEKVKKAFAKLEAGLQEYGASFIKWVAESPYTAVGGAVGGYAALKLAMKFAPTIFSKLFGKGTKGSVGGLGGATGVQPVYVVNMPGANAFQAYGYGLGPQAGAGTAPTPGGFFRRNVGKGMITATSTMGKVGQIAGIAGGLLGAAGLGVAFGTLIDQTFGLSDAFSDWATSTGTVETHKKTVKEQTVLDQAKALASMSTKGIASVEKAGGGRMELTRENITQYLSEAAKKQGLSKEQYQALVPAIREAFKGAPINIIVKPGGGIDKVETKASRGKQ